MLECWGSNNNGQIGDGTYENRLTPVDPGALTRVGLIALRGRWRRQTCAIERLIRRLEGRQVAVTGLGGSVVSIALGFSHSCAALVSGLRKEEGERGCWLCAVVCRDRCSLRHWGGSWA